MKRITLVLGFVGICLAGSVWAADGSPDASLQSTMENNRTHQASTWVNPDTGDSGTTVPTRTFENAVGQPCREFTQTVIIGGQRQEAYGTACRQPDASWKIVNDQPPATAEVPAQRPQVVYVREAPAPPVYSYPYPYAYRPYPYDYYPYFPFSLGLSFSYFSGGHGYGGHGWGGGYGHHH
jgi:hypothetical protein